MFEKIVLAVDGSEHSKRAVPVAADLAQKYGGEVIAVHVREREVSRAGAVDFETTEEGQRIVDEAVRALKDVGASARGESWGTIYGRAAAEIVRVAADERHPQGPAPGRLPGAGRSVATWTHPWAGASPTPACARPALRRCRGPR